MAETCSNQDSHSLPECPPASEETADGPSGADWESHTEEESDKASLSLCVSELHSKKRKGERFRALGFNPVPFLLVLSGLIFVLF